MENGKAMELRIYNQQDRLDVAGILIKNGYTVSQRKERRTPTGKTYDYYLQVKEEAENADTAK
jgi:hypothetical protein